MKDWANESQGRFAEMEGETGLKPAQGVCHQMNRRSEKGLFAERSSNRDVGDLWFIIINPPGKVGRAKRKATRKQRLTTARRHRLKRTAGSGAGEGKPRGLRLKELRDLKYPTQLPAIRSDGEGHRLSVAQRLLRSVTVAA